MAPHISSRNEKTGHKQYSSWFGSFYAKFLRLFKYVSGILFIIDLSYH